MKKSFLFILLIVPAMLIFTAAAMKYARGPYYICSGTDNDYLYLVSSLAMAESKQVFFTDHPGTTLQMLGAAVLKITHSIVSSGNEQLAFAVLKNPEFYLKAINIVLVSLNVLILMVIGLVTFVLTKNIWLSLLLQLSPFFSDIPLKWGLNNVSCEPLLLFTTMLFMLVLVKMIFNENLHKNVYWYAGILAFISGFGMATKVTFAPLLIIPLIILPKLHNKIGYLILTGLSAILWTWPIHSQYERILNFFFAILTRTNWYGYGDTGIDIASMQNNIMNMLKVFLYNPLSILIIFTPVLILIKYSLSPAVRKITWQDTSFKVLLAVIISLLISALIVLKQSAERYALPSLSLIGFLLFLQLICLQKRDYFRVFDAKKVTFFFIVLFLSLGLWRSIEFTKSFNELLSIKKDCLAYYPKAEEQYKNYLKVFVNLQPRSIAPFTLAGLSYGNNMTSHQYNHIKEISEGKYSKGLYSDALQNIYGDIYFHNLCSGEFYTWVKGIFIEDIIFKRQVDKIVFFFPPNFMAKQDIWLPCKTGSLLHLKDVSEGIYDNIYILDGILMNGVNIEKFHFHCY